VCPGVAAAVASPPFYSVDTAPGTVLENLHLVGGRMPLQVFTIVCESSRLVGFDVVQGIGQRHVPIRVVVTVALAIRGDMDELRPSPRFGKPAQETLRKSLAVAQNALKSHSPGDGTVIEEQGNAPIRWEPKCVSHGRINLFPAHILPFSGAH